MYELKLPDMSDEEARFIENYVTEKIILAAKKIVIMVEEKIRDQDVIWKVQSNLKLT